MPVLILAVASLVIFVIVVSLMAWANVAEEREAKRTEVLAPGAPFRVLSICDAFEEEYASLWDTQVTALQLVAAEGAKGLPVQRLTGFYKKSAVSYPELYDGSDFQQWLTFLQTAELVTVTESRVAITKQGRDFLKYRVQTPVAA